MNLRIPADTITVDTDEGRFVLKVNTDLGNTIVIDFHSCSLDFYEEVRRKLAPYVHDMEWARATMPERGEGVDLEAVSRLERMADAS